MQSVWTCSGEDFGYLVGRNLRTFSGYHVGCLVDVEFYGVDGSYLGEFSKKGRLVFDLSKMKKRRKPFKPHSDKRPLVKRADIPSVKIPTGFKDFPSAIGFNHQIERKRAEGLLKGYIDSEP